MAIGPVQMLVLGFAEPNFTGKIAAELDRLRQFEFIKIVDALVVNKDDEGNVVALQVSDLSPDEATEMGEIVGALIGFGYGTEEAVEAGAEAGAEAMADGHLIPDEDAWYVADAIPNGTAAAIILIEHMWAIPLRNSIVEAGGIALADEWIHAEGSDRGRRSCRRGGVARLREGWSRTPRPPLAPAAPLRQTARVMTESAPPPPPADAPQGADAESGGAAPQPELRDAGRLRRNHRRPGGGRLVLLPQARLRGAAVRVRHPAGRARLRQPAFVVADSLPRAERPHRRRLDSVPARDVGPQAGRGLQDRRAGAADRATRHHPRLLRHAQPRCRARTRGAADRDRQRHGRARRAPHQARCAPDGERRDRRRRELRRDRDAARLPDRRCIPDDGGRRARRSADGDGAGARAARRRHRIADLHRPRRVDGLRDVLARGAGHSAGGKPDRGGVPLGDRDRHPGSIPRHGHSPAGPRAPADRCPAESRADPARRRRDRHPRPDLRRGDRQALRLRPLLRAGPASGSDRGCGYLVGRER